MNTFEGMFIFPSSYYNRKTPIFKGFKAFFRAEGRFFAAIYERQCAVFAKSSSGSSNKCVSRSCTQTGRSAVSPSKTIPQVKLTGLTVPKTVNSELIRHC